MYTHFTMRRRTPLRCNVCYTWSIVIDWYL